MCNVVCTLLHGDLFIKPIQTCPCPNQTLHSYCRLTVCQSGCDSSWRHLTPVQSASVCLAALVLAPSCSYIDLQHFAAKATFIRGADFDLLVQVVKSGYCCVERRGYGLLEILDSEFTTLIDTRLLCYPMLFIQIPTIRNSFSHQLNVPSTCICF